MSACVVIAAGGTGGHVIPALAVSDVLRSRDVKVVWLGTRSGLEARLVPAAGVDIRWIDVAGLRGKGLVSTLVAPLKLLGACVQCLSLLTKLKPRAVLGMGGFVSGPAGIAALILRKPLVLHEQNAIPGMTNRHLSRFATRVFSAWANVFGSNVGAEVVGNPVPASIASLARDQRLAEDAFVSGHVDDKPVRALRVLVVGGSRGASILNTCIPEALKEIDFPISVRHQCGAGNQASVSDSVKALNQTDGCIDVSVEAFIDDMASAYQWADLVICRAGAMTVTELSALAKPSVLVPFPHAVDDHQTANARRLSDKGAAILLPQNELTATRLVTELKRFSRDRDVLVTMSLNARQQFLSDAAERVADALIEVSQ